MSTIIFLTIEQVLVIHEDQVGRYGGSSGIRDLTLLESALYRPQTTFGGAYLYETIFDMAAALIHSLISNHPFIDGNKRTGVVASLVFLNLNGYELVVDEDELVSVALSISEKEKGIEDIAEWLKKHAKKIAQYIYE